MHGQPDMLVKTSLKGILLILGHNCFFFESCWKNRKKSPLFAHAQW